MANPKIYTKVEITAAGGAKGSGNQYDLPLQDEISTPSELVTETAEDGQTVLNAIDGSFDIFLYDETVLSDANVQDDATLVDPAKLWLYGATGSDDLTIDNVRIIGKTDRQTTDRIGARLTGSIRATSDPFSTS